MNLILSAAAGYNWSQLEIFVKSLRKIYTDKVVLILNNPNIELINQLVGWKPKRDLSAMISDISVEMRRGS